MISLVDSLRNNVKKLLLFESKEFIGEVEFSPDVTGLFHATKTESEKDGDTAWICQFLSLLTQRLRSHLGY